VFLDRPVKCPSELVLSKRWDRSAGAAIKEVIGIERGISEAFEGVAVKLIRSAFADGHHLAAHGQSILSLESAGYNSVLLDAVQAEGVTGIAGYGAASCAV